MSPDEKQQQRYKRMAACGRVAIPLIGLAVALMLFTAAHPRIPTPMRIMAGSALPAIFVLGWKMCSILPQFEQTCIKKPESKVHCGNCRFVHYKDKTHCTIDRKLLEGEVACMSWESCPVYVEEKGCN